MGFFKVGTNLEYSNAGTKFEIWDTPSPLGRECEAFQRQCKFAGLHTPPPLEGVGGRFEFPLGRGGVG
ncbi:MAG: hypothetical protein LBN95_01260 [Prevotellaceae bacterium]|nr:hypothetical protein [Prevotellaceae bacterium]